jgi:hypothetical protein
MIMTTSLASAAPDPLAIPTFILAMLGFAGAVIALVWQFATFNLTGSRIKAEFRAGFRGPGGVALIPRGDSFTKKDMARLAEQGFIYPVASLQVRSIGRMQANITGCELDCDGGFKVKLLSDFIGPEFPHRMEPSDEQNWYFEGSLIEAMKAGAGVLNKDAGKLKIWAVVSLGNGKTVRAKGVLLV